MFKSAFNTGAQKNWVRMDWGRARFVFSNRTSTILACNVVQVNATFVQLTQSWTALDSPMRPLFLSEPISWRKSLCCILRIAASFQMYLRHRAIM